jgi:hypothetical protein
VELHHRIWAAMREEVTKAYRRAQHMGNGVNGA